MVQVLRPQNRQKPSFAQSIVGGLAEGTADELKHYAENKGVERQLGINLSGIKDPNTRAQIIAEQLKSKRKFAQSQAEAGINYSTGEITNQGKNNNSNEKSTLGFESEKQTGETVEKVNTTKGKRTIPVTKPTMNLDQMIQKSHEIGAYKRANNIPANDQDELKTLIAVNNITKQENEEIKKKQTEYGQKYLDKLQNVWGESPPNDEIQSLFKKMGENAYAEGKTEGEIEADASKEARIFKNRISNATDNVRKYINEGGFDKNQNSIKISVQPTLDEGLFDTVRGILDEAGAYPEQIEKIVSNLTETTKKTLAPYEKQARPDESWWDLVSSGKSAKPKKGYDSYKTPYAPEQMEVIKNNIKEVFQNDPATNLVLLREAYHDKDVEWDEFKDIVEELFLKGEIELNDDQENQLTSTLVNPPLEGLGKILKNLRLF